MTSVMKIIIPEQLKTIWIKNYLCFVLKYFFLFRSLADGFSVNMHVFWAFEFKYKSTEVGYPIGMGVGHKETVKAGVRTRKEKLDPSEWLKQEIFFNTVWYLMHTVLSALLSFFICLPLLEPEIVGSSLGWRRLFKD